MNARKFISAAEIVALTLFLLLVTGQAVKAESVNVPRTSVSMDPPEGFSMASAFAGFENLATHSSITITELPAEAYSQLEPIFTDLDAANQSFAAQRIKIDDISTVVVDGEEVALLEGSQSAQLVKVRKYIVALKSEATVLVIFNLAEDQATTRDSVIASVESIQLGAVATLEQKMENLRFTFEAKEPFETSEVMGGSAALLTTFDGTDPTGKKPVIIIASSLQRVGSSNIESLSAALLTGTQGFEQAEFDDGETVSLPGGSAFLQEANSGTQLAIQYLWLTPDSQYIRFLALGASEQIEQLRETIQNIAGSVMPRNE